MKGYLDHNKRLLCREGANVFTWVLLLAELVALTTCDTVGRSLYVQNHTADEVLSASSIVQQRVAESIAAEEAAAAASEATEEVTAEEGVMEETLSSEIALTLIGKIITLEGTALTVEEPTVSIYDAAGLLLFENMALSFSDADQTYISEGTLTLTALSSGTAYLYFIFGDESYETSKSFALTEDPEQSVTITVYMAESEAGDDA